MLKRTMILLCTLLAGGLVIGLTSQVVEAQKNPNPAVIPPQAQPYGLSYGEWGAQWWSWAVSFPLEQYPPLQAGGEVDCSLGQSGSVWFLAGTSGQGRVTRSCTIPTGTALFFPIINYINDYPCPDPSFQPAPGQTLEEFLADGAAAIIDAVTDLNVSVDKRSLNDLFDYRAISSLFMFTADLSLMAIDQCVTGTEQSGVTDGYWLLLTPLSLGQHTISFGGKADFGGGSTFETQVTYDITVVPSGR
jgi:hypothetical protein